MADKCFVLMPFKHPFNRYYKDILVPAIHDAGLAPYRADEIYGTGPFSTDIFDGIGGAAVLVADVTGRNPNVNYELGIAHALGRPVVIISQTIDDVPSDYRQLRIIIYDTSDPTWAEDLRKTIKETLLQVTADPRTFEFSLARGPVYFSVISKRSDKCLDVEGWEKHNGARIQQYGYHGGENQIWALRPAAGGYFYVLSKDSRKYFDVEGSSKDENARVHQWEFVGTPNQQWKLDLLGDGSYRITARHSAKCLTVKGGSYDDGADIVQYTWHGSDNQRWWLKLIL